MDKRLLRKRLPRHWNRIPFTGEMLEAFAALDGVEIVEECLLEKDGYYYNCGNAPFIALNRELRGIRRDFALAHELAHYWCHHPGAVHCLAGFDKKAEAEADLVAICCLVPLPLLRLGSIDALMDALDLPQDLAELRLRVFVESGL